MINHRIVTLIGVSILLFSCLVFPLVLKQASAHISREFGDYTVQIGWDDEPVYSGLSNMAYVAVKKGSGDNVEPVINALKDVQILVKYGTVTKELDFVPSEKENGAYVAPIIPTRVGSYSLVFKGSVEGQVIDSEIPLDDVHSITELNFPQASSGGEDAANLGQVSSTLAQLANDIEDAKMKSDQASQSVLSAVDSFKDAKNANDKLYLISMTGIGIGIAGVVIAIIAINKNKPAVRY